MTKLLELFEMAKSIKLLEKPYLGKEGIKIVASYNVKKIVVEEGPADAALILQDNDLIHECKVGHSDIIIKWGWIIDLKSLGAHVDDNGIAEMSWENFVLSFDLSDFEAQCIIARKITEEWGSAIWKRLEKQIA